MADFQIAAHRGSTSTAVHENTLAAFELAIHYGADWVELDIRMTRDGRLVCFHDPTLNGQAVEALTFQALHALCAAEGFELAALDEVLTALEGRIQLDLEIKVEGIEENVVHTVETHIGTTKFVYTSFHDQVVARLKTLSPTQQAGLILGVAKPAHKVWTRLSELFPKRRIQRCNADFVVPHYKLIRLGFLSRMRRISVPVWVWVVNNPHQIEDLFRRKVAVLITDDVDAAVRLVRGQ